MMMIRWILDFKKMDQKNVFFSFRLCFVCSSVFVCCILHNNSLIYLKRFCAPNPLCQQPNWERLFVIIIIIAWKRFRWYIWCAICRNCTEYGVWRICIELQCIELESRNKEKEMEQWKIKRALALSQFNRKRNCSTIIINHFCV